MARYQEVPQDCKVVVIEGLAPDSNESNTDRLNLDIARTLDADVILVTTPENRSADKLKEQVELSARLFDRSEDPEVVGVILNKVSTESQSEQSIDKAFENSRCRILGKIPWNPQLMLSRMLDIHNQLETEALFEGQLAARRVQHIAVVANTIANLKDNLQPGTLLVTAGDREDLIVATLLAVQVGVPIAGILLTDGLQPNSSTLNLGRNVLANGLPILLTKHSLYDTARKLANLSPEVSLDDSERIEQVMESIAAHIDSQWLRDKLNLEQHQRLSPAAFRYQLAEKARAANKRIVLPEGNEPRTIEAAINCQQKGLAQCILLGEREEVSSIAKTQGLKLPEGLKIVDPVEVRDRYVKPMVALRKHKGMATEMAAALLEDNVYLGTMMVAEGDADGLVSGAVHTTANTVRPALQLIKTHPKATVVSSIFFMLLPEQVLVYGDCAINPDPDADTLADIAIQSAFSARAFGIEPRVAMISYSTGESGEGRDVDKVREATRLIRERCPELLVDGPLQYDAAANIRVAKSKAPDSPVAGRATVFIFPDLNTGNTTYKAVQRSAKVVTVGPMLQGLKQPVNDLSRGATVNDIVYTIALTGAQAAQPMPD